MARRGEPDLSGMYASVAVGATVIGSLMVHIPGAIAAARDGARLQAMHANSHQLFAQVNELLDRLDEHRQLKYVDEVEIRAIEALIRYHDLFEEICETETDGFAFVARLRKLAVAIINKIAELDGEAELNARLALSMLDLDR